MAKAKVKKTVKSKKESYDGIWGSGSLGTFGGFANDTPEKAKRRAEIEKKLAGKK